MITSLLTPTVFFAFSLLTGTEAKIFARPAVQALTPRAQYQGGWPLALSGSSSPACPAEASVRCSSNIQNPACCPAGQTCIFGASQDAQYCCPTSVDCNTAVLDSPRCANTTWNMFLQIPAGYFCCEPGMAGVNPRGGLSNSGICEPADQVIPTSLLATMTGQATPSPTSSTANQTQPGGPMQTNPSSPTGAATAISGGGIGHWSTPLKIGVGIAIIVATLLVLALASICNRRRNPRAIGYGVHYDEYGNAISGYGGGGHESYRRTGVMNEGGQSQGNKVTVNVVHGDHQQHY